MNFASHPYRRVGWRHQRGEVAPVLAQPGERLELGRSCVDPDYRSRAVIDRLWSGIADYVQGHGIGLMFGCASLPGTRLDELAPLLAYLHHHHLAPPDCRPRGVEARYLDMRRLPRDLCRAARQAFASRKALAGHAERQVASGLAELRQAA